MHIYNPTNEKIPARYASRYYNFAPEDVKVVEDKATANHIINVWGPRGLVTLEFGDDTKKAPGGGTVMEMKAEQGRKINLEFKRKMVIDHNQMNEANYQQQLPYVSTSEEVKGYAKELGIKLLKPYEVDDLQQQQMNRMEVENRELRGMISEQGGQIRDLLTTIKTGGLQAPAQKSAADIEAEVKATELKEMIDKVKAYNRKDYFKKWFDENLDAVKLWPEEAKTVVRKKYTELIGGEDKI